MSTSLPPSTPPSTPPPLSTPPLSTPPFQSAPEPPFGTTPVRTAVYTALKEQLAVKAHRVAGLALHPTPVEPNGFWMETLETPDSYQAAKLSDANVTTLKQQYRKLAELLYQTPKSPESQSYISMTIIMNVLSLAGAKAHPLPHDQVVGWFLNPTQPLFGDPFAKSFKPDIVAYLVPRKTAEDYLGCLQSKTKFSNLNNHRPAWAQMISAAELKVRVTGESQLLNYLEAICCYRPDLISVVAISSNLAGYQFYYLNAACCLKYDTILQWGHQNTPSLQKFITAVYQTQILRYDKMNYLSGTLQAWSLEHGSEPARRWDMLPFHTGHYPGRGTWVACAIEATKATEATEATSLSPEVHIVKFYWADARSKWNEGDLYDDAHGEVEIPGLARVVDHWKTGKVVSGSWKPGAPITKREQVCVILGSTGCPLNECKDVNQILGCIFDLLETLRAMRHRDVIHRDISWGNAMINPTPTNSVAGPVVSRSDEQPPLYISQILEKGMPGSLSLLADLDCSATLQGMKEDAKAGRHSRTGTPMFIAMEISSTSVGWRCFPSKVFRAYLSSMPASNRLCPRYERLEQKVLEQLEHCHVHFLKEFLDTTPNLKPEQKPPLVHTPRHDAESVFWLLWFLLARANPQGEHPVEKGSTEKKVYDHFCSVMLNHTVGAITEARESLAGMAIEQYRQTLHPHFSHLGDMLYYMGKYFLIDPRTWDDYNKDPFDHASYFMECLLLGEMLQKKEPGNLPLNIDQPRLATDPMAHVQSRPATIENRSSHNYSPTHSASSSVPSSGSKWNSDTGYNLRSGRHQGHGALAGAPQTEVQSKIVPPEQNPSSSTPEANEEDGRATEDESVGYLASQESPEMKTQLEQDVLNKWPEIYPSLVQAFDAVKAIQNSKLRGERWFTVSVE